MSTGIVIRHSRGCVTQADRDAKCSCKPSFRAEVFDKRSGKKLRKTFRNQDEAKGWRHDTASGLRNLGRSPFRKARARSGTSRVAAKSPAPNTLPARADASPALVCSEIRSRSNSASEAKMPNTSLPADVVVSIDAPWPVSALKPMLRVLRSWTPFDGK